MRAIPFLRRCIVALFLTVLATACGSSDTAPVQVVVIGEQDDPFEQGVHLSPAGQLTRAATTEGLVSFDAEGRIVPALADRWIVTDDGKSYIFRLRDGTWLGGGRITATQARSALREAVRALSQTPLALDLGGIEEIRVMTGRVLEIKLTRAMPHFLQLLAQPELGLRSGGSAPGPMALERVGDTAVLTPVEPSQLDLPAVENWTGITRQVHLRALPAEEAVERLNRGDADIVLGGTIADFPSTRKVGILRGTIQLDPVQGLLGLLVKKAGGFLAKPANREAVSMAIDREALIAPFGIDGWTPATRIVAPGLDGDGGTIGERWEEWTLEQRRAEASARVTRWRLSQDEPEEIGLSVWLREGSGSDLLFAGLARDMSSIGLDLVRAKDTASADLRLIDDVARYPRAAWFLNRLSCKSKRGLCDESTDELVAVAMQTDDAVERARLIADAEVELTVANLFIPFGAPIRWSLVRGNVSGFASNRLGWHPLMPMALPPK